MSNLHVKVQEKLGCYDFFFAIPRSFKKQVGKFIKISNKDIFLGYVGKTRSDCTTLIKVLGFLFFIFDEKTWFL